MNKKIIIGTAQSDPNYGFNKKKNLISLINFCKKKNLYFDTALSYKNSKFYLRKLGYNYTNIISKLPYIDKIFFKVSLEKNLKKIYSNLNTKKIYSILLHDPSIIDDKKNRAILFEKIKYLKKKGKIEKFGVSVYTVNELKKILKVFKPDIIQIPINIFNQSFTEKNFLKKIKRLKIEIHVRSIFLQGLLLLSYDKIPRNFKNNKAIKFYFNFIERNNLSPIVFNLNFINSIKEIDSIVIGFDNIEQFKKLLELKKKIINEKYSKKIYSKFKSKNLKLIDPRKW